MSHVSAPGKLFLSGEWAVLEIGNPGLVAAVNKRVHSSVNDNDNVQIIIDDFGIDCNAELKEYSLNLPNDIDNEKMKFIKNAIEISIRFLKENNIEIKPFKIRTWGEMSQIVVNGESKKLGFGSSAASTVAVIASLLDFHEYNYKKEELYKLAAISHYFAQGKIGSGFDIAASVYGGIFLYKRFDPEWLIKNIEKKKLVDIINQEWPSFKAENIEIPDDFILLVGWTKQSASTSEMVKQMRTYKEKKPDEYKKLYDEISKIAETAINSLKNNDKEKFLEALKKNEILLRELGEKSGVNIETKELKKLSEIANSLGGAGKLSGAGGGDCGIAVCFNEDVAEKIKNQWAENGIIVLDVCISKEGVKKE